MFSVLICTTDQPGYGGAAISSEGLASWLQQNGVETRLLFPNSIVPKFKPDIIIGKNYFGYRKVRQELGFFGKIPRVYLPSGLKVMADGLSQFVDRSTLIKEAFSPARKAVEDAEYIVANSPYVYGTYLRSFNLYREKISPFVFYDCLFTSPGPSHNLTWDQRDIGVLFIASDWARPVKNLKFVKELTSSLDDKWVGIVGKRAILTGGKRFTNYGFQNHEKILKLLPRVKVLVIPSLFDSSPNILVEALHHGVNVVVSKNVGTFSWTHPDLVCSRCDKDEFLKTIKKGLKKPLNQKIPIDKDSHGKEFLDLLKNWSRK